MNPDIDTQQSTQAPPEEEKKPRASRRRTAPDPVAEAPAETPPTTSVEGSRATLADLSIQTTLPGVGGAPKSVYTGPDGITVTHY